MFSIILRILGNYALVQLAIVAFMAPFYWLYHRKHPRAGSINREAENFFNSHYANWLVFFWAMSEALIWFVIPEFLLILLVFMRIRRKRELLYYDIYGTAVGTFVAFIIHIPTRWIAHLPYIQPNMVLLVRQWFDHHGLLGLIYQPLSGVPYKVFTHLAPDYHFFFPVFLLFAIIVRISRYYAIYVLLSSLYPFLHKYVYRNYVRLFLIATFIFSALLLKVYLAYGPAYHLVH